MFVPGNLLDIPHLAAERARSKSNGETSFVTSRNVLLAAASFGALTLAAPASADEGMWTFEGFPTERVREAYGWAPDQEWLDNVQNAAVRLTGGCSASFVSPDGLILTNHHCIASCLYDNSTDEIDYLLNGYVAERREDELKCPGQQAEVVTMITDVTPVSAQTVIEKERPVTAFTIRATYRQADSAYIRTVPLSESVR